MAYTNPGKAGGGLAVTIQGDKHLIARLKQYRTVDQKKAIRKGLRAGAKVVARETRAESPVLSGLMKKSFKVRAMKRSRVRLGVLVQSGEGFFKGETYYAAFVALGHKAGHRRLGDARKQVPPNEFMKTAADNAAPEAIETLNDTIHVELDKFAATGRK